jgi:hypothetical protein
MIPDHVTPPAAGERPQPIDYGLTYRDLTPDDHKLAGERYRGSVFVKFPDEPLNKFREIWRG